MADSDKKQRSKYICSVKYRVSNYHKDHPFSSNRILDKSDDRLVVKVLWGSVQNSKKDAKKDCAKKLYKILNQNDKNQL